MSNSVQSAEAGVSLPPVSAASLHEHLASLTGNDAQTTSRLIRMFIDVNVQALEAVAGAIDKEAWTDVQQQAHKIAGGLRLLGCDEVVAALYKVERLAREQHAVSVRQAWPVVAAAVARINQLLSDMR